MAEKFDPYYVWLSIAPEEQPPTLYRLLGLRPFEDNLDVIENAADRQMAHLRTYQAGRHSEDSQRLLNQVASAKLTMLKPEKKAEYDKVLREQMDLEAESVLNDESSARQEELSMTLVGFLEAIQAEKEKEKQTKEKPSDFDPYEEWLAIAPEERPPTLYRLLGLRPLEDNRNTIINAAKRRVAHLRQFASDEHGDEVRKLLNQVSSARITLLNRKKKVEYDRLLRERMKLEDEGSQPDEELSTSLAAFLGAVGAEKAKAAGPRESPKQREAVAPVDKAGRDRKLMVGVAIGVGVLLLLVVGVLAWKLGGGKEENPKEVVVETFGQEGWLRPSGKESVATILSGDHEVSQRVNNIVFDFETGDLQGWRVVEGRFDCIVSDRAKFHNIPDEAYNKQGKYHLTTLEIGSGEKGGDEMTGVVKSPMFVLSNPNVSMLVGGGKHNNTYVALCTVDGKEVRQARGNSSELMRRVEWSVPQLVGRPAFLRIVDRNVSEWGHVTFDDFRAKGKLASPAKEESWESPSKPSPTTTAAPLVALNFEETSGKLLDSSGNNHHGEVVGNVLYGQPGKQGTALGFDGKGGHIVIEGSEKFNFNKDFTWTAWVKTIEDGPVVTFTNDGAKLPDGGKILSVRQHCAHFLVGGAGGARSPRFVNDDKWRHLAVTATFDERGKNQEVVVYVDGESDSVVGRYQGSKWVSGWNKEWNSKKMPEGNFLFKIGFHNNREREQLTGLIDTVTIWDRALSPEEIVDLAAGKTFKPPKIAATSEPPPLLPKLPPAPAHIVANASEASDYYLVYQLPIDEKSFSPSQYVVNNSESVPDGGFNRIAYYLELDSKEFGKQFVWVSMDAFTTDASLIDVPNTDKHTQQRIVDHMNVVSDVSGIVNGTDLKGNIEFWRTNYGGNPSNIVPGGTGKFDFDDTRKPGNYGSMQVHNFGAKQTLFAYNKWNKGPSDLGIGNSTHEHPDWTFSHNANQYTSKTLYVLIAGPQLIDKSPDDAPAKPTDVAVTTPKPPPSEPPSHKPTAKRLPVPTSDAQATTLQQLDKVHKFSQRRMPAERLKFARDLFEAAEKSQDGSVEKFVLLRKAMELAQSGGDAGLMLEAVDAISDEFDVNAPDVKWKVLAGFVSGASNVGEIKSFVEAAGPVIDEAIAAGRYDVAVNIAETAYRFAMKAGDAELRKRAYDRRNEVRNLAERFRPVQTARKTLQSDPNDPAANLVVGRWLCFERGDWEEGLPHLAKCSSLALKGVAEQELKSTPATPDAQVALADKWRTLAEQVEGKEKDALMVHAGEWYGKALDGLPEGLARAKVQRRLDEIAKISASLAGEPEKPKELKCPKLPKELTIDLPSGVKMDFVLIPAGQFVMGSSEVERQIALAQEAESSAKEKILTEGPQHHVKITRSFYLGKYEVTQAQWQAVMGSNPSNSKGPMNPVEQVSWGDIQQFLPKLNAIMWAKQNAGSKARVESPTDETPPKPSAIGSILHEMWTEIPGSKVGDLLNSGRLNTTPDEVRVLTSLEAPKRIGANYGARIHGYLHPPADGDYAFQITSDDGSELYLSSDDHPGNKQEITLKAGTGNPSNQQKVSLKADQRYYIEVLHKQGGGGDFVTVYWQRPGGTREVIPGDCLSRFDAGTPDGGLALGRSHPMGPMTFALPSEAQWEYACRAGTTTAYCFGNNAVMLAQYGWFKGNSLEQTHPVGQGRSNAFGLFDMHGNVWEWCSDWYGADYYGKSPPADPAGPPTGSHRVIRGGAAHELPGRCRAAFRRGDSPAFRGNYLGFRVALVPVDAPDE